MTTKTLAILLVEDNAGDVVLLQEAFRQAHVECQLQVVEDGLYALECLAGTGAFAGAPRPDVVLLDLNLPRVSGREVIAHMLGDPLLRDIPLVVLTSSQHEQEVLSGWNPRRCLYLVKPPTFGALVDIALRIVQFLREL